MLKPEYSGQTSQYALDPSIARPSATMVLTLQDKQVLVERFQVPALSQWWKIYKIEMCLYIFPKAYQHDQGSIWIAGIVGSQTKVRYSYQITGSNDHNTKHFIHFYWSHQAEMADVNLPTKACWCHIAKWVLVNISSGNGLLSGNATPLPKPMLTSCQ